MPQSHSHFRFAPQACVFAGLLALAGCDRDDAAELKNRVDRWVSVGSATYFESQYGCTAAVYELVPVGFKAASSRVNNVAEGLHALRRGRPVAFDIPALSPTQISELISSSNLPEGIGVIGAGVSAAECMSDTVKQSYVAALNTPGIPLIYDTSDNALALADFKGKTLYFAGGRN
jgi:hypothetical protein